MSLRDLEVNLGAIAPLPIEKTVSSGSLTLEVLAHQLLGSVSNFRDIADSNGLNVLAELPPDTPLAIPSRADIEARAIATVRQFANASGILDYGSGVALDAVKQSNTAQQLISWII